MRRQNNGYCKLQGNGYVRWQRIVLDHTCCSTPTSQILFKRRRVVSQASARLLITFFFFSLEITSAIMVRKLRKLPDSA